jgi:proteasome lid subunit RPN8/RPN11
MKLVSVANQTEICFVLLGEFNNGICHAKLSWRRSGSHSSVQFDGNRVLDREEKYGDVVGFYHTHPEGFVQPSDRDVRTMGAWCFSFGKPLICAVGTSAGVQAWLFEPGIDGGEQCARAAKFSRNWFVATLR